MAHQTQDTIGRPITALADRGNFNGEEILRCDAAGIVPLVPKPQTSNNKAAGLFDKSDFVYNEADATYRCRWRTSHPPHDGGRKRPDIAQVLFLGLPAMSAQA